MTYQSMENLTNGQLLTEDHMDKLRENIEFLAGLQANGTALSGLSASNELPLPLADYDSGWFATTSGSTYLKAHGLSTQPRFYVGMVARVASPTSSDYVQHFVTWNVASVDVDGTNLRFRTIGSYAGGDGDGLYSSGYGRVLAWS